METIQEAACIAPDGSVWHLPRPCRHHHILWTMARAFDGHMVMPDDQGFWTSEGRYVQREEAARIAVLAGQIEKPNWPPDLYSEDLW